jgi:hypothetical protein
LIGGVLSWCYLWLALVLFGFDAPEGAVLQIVGTGALVTAAASVCLAVVALARGPQRVAASFGLATALLFLLIFTGLGFALLPNP